MTDHRDEIIRVQLERLCKEYLDVAIYIQHSVDGFLVEATTLKCVDDYVISDSSGYHPSLQDALAELVKRWAEALCDT